MVFNDYEKYKDLTGVYTITNLINNFVYVGATFSKFKFRYQTHKSSLKRNLHDNKNLQNDYNKYGTNVFEFNVIQVSNDIDEIKNIESNLISDYLNKNVCYNVRGGGENVGNVTSETTKKKMSESHKGKKLSEYQKECLIKYNKNKEISEITKTKLSERFQGENSNFAKLTDDCVVEIKRKIINGMSDREIAAEYDVEEDCISNIRYNYRWKHIIVDGWEEYQAVRKRRRKYTDEEILLIKQDIIDGKSNFYINKKYGTSYDKIKNIRKSL